jgi:hypothetical protein
MSHAFDLVMFLFATRHFDEILMRTRPTVITSSVPLIDGAMGELRGGEIECVTIILRETGEAVERRVGQLELVALGMPGSEGCDVSGGIRCRRSAGSDGGPHREH